MSRKIYNRLSFMAVNWLDESTLGQLGSLDYIRRDWVYTPPIQTEAPHLDEESLDEKRTMI
jgi:hypothetical protein